METKGCSIHSSSMYYIRYSLDVYGKHIVNNSSGINIILVLRLRLQLL